MPANKSKRAPQTRQLVSHQSDDPDAVSRSIDAIAAQLVPSTRKERDSQVVNLAVGANVLRHKLGRTPTGAAVTPTTADATFAWALTAKSATTVTITTVGVAQTAATLEVF